MQEQPQETIQPLKQTNASGGCLKTLGLIVFASVLTAALVIIGIKVFLFPGEFKPVELSANEELVLNEKIATIKPRIENAEATESKEVQEPLGPLAYSEIGAIREVSFTEREINALLASNTDYATNLAIDFEPDLASARLRLPVDPDAPILGGKTIRASAGLELRYEHGKPVVILKGVYALLKSKHYCREDFEMSNLTMEDLKSRMCRWPFGNPEDDSFHFCGDRTEPESSYCDTHTEKAKSTYRKRIKN